MLQTQPVFYFIGTNGMKFFALIVLALVIGGTFAISLPVAAQTSGSGTVSIPNPIACADVTCLISQVIRYILGSIAIIATLMFIWGGYMMLTSGGNADQVKRAKETLAWAAIGIVVIFLSWVIIRFVLSAISGTTT